MNAGVIAHGAWPGLAVAAVVAIAATFLSVHYGASAMLFALLLGMALNFLAEEGRCLPGIQMASTTVLRLRLTWANQCWQTTLDRAYRTRTDFGPSHRGV